MNNETTFINFDELTFEEIDLLQSEHVNEIVRGVESDTNWLETINHITYNGVKMCK